MNTNDALEDFIISNKPDTSLSEAHMEDLMTKIDDSVRLGVTDHSVAPTAASTLKRKFVVGTSVAAALALGVGVATAILPNAQSPAQASPLHGVSIAPDPKMTQQLEENCSNAPMEDGGQDESPALTLQHAEDRGTFTVGWLEATGGKKFMCLDYASASSGDTTLLPYTTKASDEVSLTIGASFVYVDPAQGQANKEYTLQANATDPSITRYEATLLDRTVVTGTVFEGQLLLVSDIGGEVDFSGEEHSGGSSFDLDFESANLASIELIRSDGSSLTISRESDSDESSTTYTYTTKEKQ